MRHEDRVAIMSASFGYNMANERVVNAITEYKLAQLKQKREMIRFWKRTITYWQSSRRKWLMRFIAGCRYAK
jgi:hypothetical protein